MKTEFTDVSETQKTVTIEIDSSVVDAEINRIAQGYRKVRVPGFRPGKVPATIIKRRFREQILHEVMHGLIPRAVEEALQQRGIEPIDTPNVRDVALEEGQPLRFTAAVETVPPFDPGDLSTLTATRTPVAITEIGSKANPPGFDEQLIGVNPGDEKTFPIHFPEDYTVAEMADTDVTYSVAVKEVRRRVLPELDDEFAKDVGEFESLSALRDRVRTDLQAEADENATRQLRGDVLKQLAERITFELPPSLIEREIDRRLEEFARQLMQQNVDPRQAGIDWGQFREAQREPARAGVASALVLDAIARREGLVVTEQEIDQEIERFATRAGRTPAAFRAQFEKEGGIGRLVAGLRREKAVDLALSRARIS
jgi:trigger factor